MWFWPVLILVLVILFVWWALTRQAEKMEPPAHHAADEKETSKSIIEATATAPAAEITMAEAVNDREDDLEIIEGIGPKISSVLKAAGIKTFAQLAATDADQVREILTNADQRLGRISDPTTWGEQSRLAADGKMGELQVLQDDLKGGRAS